MVEEFTKGALSVGHSVVRFVLDDMNIGPCTGCVACGYEGPCVQKDDNQRIREAMVAGCFVNLVYLR